MDPPVSDLQALLRDLHPDLHDGTYVFATLPTQADPGSVAALAMFREAESITVVVTEESAEAAHLSVLFRAAWITLSVRSDLHAVGLTAVVATALADADISCNVIAAAQHDHLFVPVADAAAAMDVLRRLQLQAR